MKTIRYIFIFLFIVATLIVASAWSIAHFYGDKIQSAAIERLNSQLNVKVDVAEVDFSLLENFPFASVQFRSVVLYSSLDSQDSLLAVDKLYCKFNILDLYHGNYLLSGLEIERGFCRIIIDENGRPNYDIWKEGSDSSSQFRLELERVDIRDLAFSLKNHQEQFDLDFSLPTSKVRATFLDDQSTFELNSTLQNSNLSIEAVELLKGRNINLQSIFTVGSKEERIYFKPSIISLENLDLSFEGDYYFGEKPTINLQISGQGLQLAKAINLLPQKYRESLLDYDIDGLAEINGQIVGELGQEKSPHLVVDFSAKDGQFKHKQSNLLFKNLRLKGTLSNGDANSMKSSTLRVEEFNSQLNQGYIEGELALWDFTQPNYTFSGKLAFQFEDLVNFFNLKDFTQTSGLIESNLSFSGQVDDFSNYSIRDFKKAGFSGSIGMKNFGFSLKKEKMDLREVDSKLRINNNQITIESLNGILNGNKVALKGDLFNLIPYLISDREKLLMDLALESPGLAIETLFPEQQSETDSLFSLPKNIHLYLDCKTAEFNWTKLNLKEFEAFLEIRDGNINARDIRFQGLGGNIRADLFWTEKSRALQSRFDFQNLDLNQLFEAFDNFSQQTIKSENINGNAFGELNSSLNLDAFGKVILSTINMESNLVIENGRLKNVSSLEALSDYIELEELKDIRFKTLQNQLFVQDCTIIIPRFDIHSSALNLSLEGQHQFDNKIDYHFTLLLNELLGNKVRKPQNEEFGYVEDDGLGQTKVFIKMSGTTSNPEFSYDKDALKTKLKSEVKKEKTTIKSLLNKEFGLFKSDSTLESSPIDGTKRKSPFKIDWSEKPNESDSAGNEEKEKKAGKKGKFGKFIDKIAKPNEEEYE